MRKSRLKPLPVIPINSSLAQDPRKEIPSYLAVVRIGNIESEFKSYQILVLTPQHRGREIQASSVC
jgi:hypothetical protein